MTIRKVDAGDIRMIMTVLDAARDTMRRSGNLHQWVDGYPSEAVILSDMEKGYAYVVESEKTIVGYFAFVPSPEPTYADIYEGAWLDDAHQYHVVHRIGSLPQVHGVFKAVMDWCFKMDRNIRVDTHRDNAIMQHCIEKYGFKYCGIIYLTSGDERLAYQKIESNR